MRNLPYKITTEEIYDIFGKFGALRQVRLGINPDTKGTAYVVYEVSLGFHDWTKRKVENYSHGGALLSFDLSKVVSITSF